MSETSNGVTSLATDQSSGPASPAAGRDEPGETGLRRSSRAALIILTALTVLAVFGFGGSWLLYSRNYVYTDNAQIAGDKIAINAPVAGTVTHWDIDQGSQVHAYQLVGRIKITGSFAQPQRVIKSPGDGIVAVNNVVNGTYVRSGAPLAVAYDFNKLYVTARVDETDIDDVRIGAPVNIDVDSYPGDAIYGTVTEIQSSTAAKVSLFPENNNFGNFEKETELIPVKIALVTTAGRRLVPGMSATVHIVKDS